MLLPAQSASETAQAMCSEPEPVWRFLKQSPRCWGAFGGGRIWHHMSNIWLLIMSFPVEDVGMPPFSAWVAPWVGLTNNAQLKNSGTVIILVLLLVSGYYVGVGRVAQTLNLTLPSWTNFPLSHDSPSFIIVECLVYLAWVSNLCQVSSLKLENVK